MKFFPKSSLLILAVASLSLSALAQGAFDLYGVPRTIVLATPTLLTAAAASVTNASIDTHGFEGIAKVDIMSFTNSGGALTATLETSTDNTNFSALANYSLAISTAIIYTNNGLATVTKATNTYLLPGSITTPTAATAGFATPYLDNTTAPFTNSGAITVTAKGIYSIGYNVSDASRYLHIVWTPTGSSSNDVVAAVFTGRKQQTP